VFCETKLRKTVSVLICVITVSDRI